ncbi:signal recognition particle-docking protein FtsY [Saccharobesus litoralis]|uniref:Signal recognition particle receptor FtsY n=1 Tax=Saccharobesus litoralis TaxID=2172099 RepID=A0A2S0VQS9_9ALTE|nr:signal recognition particle-docking protein FtsY [Saccharobesus litoralis]AWB66573.1 signal recognition particle-docking protein FtsY [Saccharobesus litoralis]
MSKKKGFFGWFGRDRTPEANEVEEKDSQTAVVEHETPQSNSAEPDDHAVEKTEEKAVEKAAVEQAVTETSSIESDEAVEAAPANDTCHNDLSANNDREDNRGEVKSKSDPLTAPSDQVANVEQSPIVGSESDDKVDEQPEKLGFFARLKKSLSRTKASLGSGFASLFKGKKIDDELYEELETQLLMADVGVETTLKIMDNVQQGAERKDLKDAEALSDILKQQMADILTEVDQPLSVENNDGPFVILMVGVNGVGKTTTIGKMAKQFQAQGKSVMLAAGDTFRAAAVEQLQVWGERNDIPVVAQHTGADSASVLFDALESAKAKNVDVLIADTAGRLQNKAHLMEELKKVVRVMKKIDPNTPHEVMLVIDAATGQNAVSQTKLFSEAVGLTGISITKLDGTAKGGVIFAIADQFKVPIRYIGVGEGIDDLRPFNSNDFIDALFDQTTE